MVVNYFLFSGVMIFQVIFFVYSTVFLFKMNCDLLDSKEIRCDICGKFFFIIIEIFGYECCLLFYVVVIIFSYK